MLTETGELTAVVTILHDRREALERARLYEQLKRRVRRTADARAGGHRGAGDAERAAAAAGDRARAGVAAEVAVPRQHVARVQDAAERDPRLHAHAAAGRRRRSACRRSSGSCTRIDSNGRHLLTIINEILDITRIEAGKMPMQISEFNLNELVPEVMTELDPVIARSKLTVTPSCAPKLPIVLQRSAEGEADHRQSAEQRAEVHAPGRHRDRRRLRRASTRMATIAVTDTGIGIAPEHHEKIFEDFRQVDDSPSRQYGGTGLGLAICRRLATALGGRITLQSTIGAGLDVHADDSRGSATMTDRTRPLILVVDDYQDAREMYAEYLQFSGFRVAEARNGNEAVDAGVRAEARSDPDGPVAAGHGRLGGDARAEGRRADASTFRSSR